MSRWKTQPIRKKKARKAHPLASPEFWGWTDAIVLRTVDNPYQDGTLEALRYEAAFLFAVAECDVTDGPGFIPQTLYLQY